MEVFREIVEMDILAMATMLVGRHRRHKCASKIRLLIDEQSACQLATRPLDASLQSPKVLCTWSGVAQARPCHAFRRSICWSCSGLQHRMWCWRGPKLPCTESVPCFVHSNKGYPSIKLRPRHCGKPILGIVAGSGEDSAEEGQTVCGRQARGRYIAHLPNQPPVLRTEQQNKDDFEELGLGGDVMMVQRRTNHLTLRRAVPSTAKQQG